MNLKQGDSGINVKNCQYTLHILTYNVNGIDGSFGPGMASAVKLYQQNNGLTVTGIVDTTTWNNLIQNINTLKVMLRSKGYYNVQVFYGVADVTLYNAVLAFQRANGLAVDGMVGPATRIKLYSTGTNNSVVSDSAFPLQQGAKGDNVLYLQYGLHVLGCAPGPIDGSFGPAVDTAVRWFQGKYGLTIDGSVGTATWNKIKALITEIQQKLYDLKNSNIVISLINGIASQETYNAVCTFQRLKGLTVDGSVGPATRTALFGTSTGSGTTANDDLPLVYGKTGKNVEIFQYALHIATFNPNGFDGSFGPGMQTAVRNFQSPYGLTVDGSVGPATWEKMRFVILPIQQALKTLGWYTADADGIANLQTYNAVKGFQSSCVNMTIDGMVGPETRRLLGISSSGDSTNTGTEVGTVSSVLTQGSNGSLVRYLQKMLNTLGYTVTVDGSFGPAMDTQVRRFQSAFGLTVDGSIGPATWRTLFTYYATPASVLGSRVNGDRIAKAAEYELSLGFSEDNANDITPYGEWYGMNGQPWCAMFVSWCAHQAGYLGNKVPRYAYCPYGKAWFVEKKRYYARSSNYKPQRGDIIFYWSGTEISHTGIIISSTSTTVTAIEGNASRMVKECTYTLTNAYIDGYGVIDSSTVAPADRPENPNLPAPDNKSYVPPAKQDNSSFVNISNLFSALEELERVAKEFAQITRELDRWATTTYIISYLKYYDYHNIFFQYSTGFNRDDFVTYVMEEYPNLHSRIEPYILENRKSLRDDLDGVIDLAHLAATIGGYTIGLLDMLPADASAYSGWAGDVATGIYDLYMANPTDYQAWADAKFGSTEISCNYSDICTDSDAIKIAELIKADPEHSFINAIKEYYTQWYDNRYSYLYSDITGNLFNSSDLSADDFTQKIINYFYSPLGLSTAALMKDAYWSDPAVKTGCKAFTKYLYYHLSN